MTHFLIRVCLVCLIILPSGCRNRDLSNKTKEDKFPVFDSLIVPAGEPVIITGVVHNRQVYPQAREIILEVPDFEGFENKQISQIDSNGSFRFKFYPTITREITLKPIADLLIVHPGDSIHIEKDFKNISDVKFTGDAANLNNNVAKFLGGYYRGRYKTQLHPNPEEHKRYCEKYRNDAYSRLKAFCNEHKTTDEFLKWAETIIEIDYYSALFQYLMYKQIMPKSMFNFSDNYYDFLDKMDQKFDNQIICSNYFKLIKNYYNYYLVPTIFEKYRGEQKKDHKRDSLFLEEISSFSKNKLINQFIVSQQFNGWLNAHNIELFDGNVGFIYHKVKEPFLLKTLTDRYRYIKNFGTPPKNLSNSIPGESDIKNDARGSVNNNLVRKDPFRGTMRPSNPSTIEKVDKLLKK